MSNKVDLKFPWQIAYEFWSTIGRTTTVEEAFKAGFQAGQDHGKAQVISRFTDFVMGNRVDKP